MPYIFIIVEVYLYFVANKKSQSILAFEAMLVGLFINQIIGKLYFHNRPFMDHIGVVLTQHAPDSSFPSDHTTFMLGIAFSLLFCKKTRNLSYILIFLGFIGGFTRVFEGVHYPFDIIGGALSGLVGAILIFLLRDKLKLLNDLAISTTNRLQRGIMKK